MSSKKMDNNGFTLLEMVVCFVLLGILLVAAAQIISSTSQVYYYTKSVSYGMQASQVVATEVRGDLEEALPLLLDSTFLNSDEKSNIASSFGSSGNSENNYSIYIPDSGKGIAVINNKGEQIMYYLKDDGNAGSGSVNHKILIRSTVEVYDNVNFNKKTSFTRGQERSYTSQYVGMNYKIKDIFFSLLPQVTDASGKTPLPGNNVQSRYPVIKMDITVSNEQYGEYSCTEYIPLYNFYGISDERRSALIHNSIYTNS